MEIEERQKRRTGAFWIMAVIAFLVAVLMTTVGTASISYKDALKAVLSALPHFGGYVDISEIKASHVAIIKNIRLPRIIISALVGMALSVSGAVLQGIFKNPMADPYVLGVSSGAAFGATLSIALGISFEFAGLSSTGLFAFAGAIGATMTVYGLSIKNNKADMTSLLLAGIAINFFLSSLISLIMTFNRDQVEKIIFWTMGSVSAASWNHVAISLPLITAGCLLAIFFARELNVMLMGDETAASLGVDVPRTRGVLLILASVISAAAVSVSGIIGFVGLVIPHVVRIFAGPDHRTLMPLVIVSGALFMMLADMLARTLASPSEIPIGVITAMLGAPYFIYLLNSTKNSIFKR